MFGMKKPEFIELTEQERKHCLETEQDFALVWRNGKVCLDKKTYDKIFPKNEK